jgi:hypothetical protein
MLGRGTKIMRGFMTRSDLRLEKLSILSVDGLQPLLIHLVTYIYLVDR